MNLSSLAFPTLGHQPVCDQPIRDRMAKFTHKTQLFLFETFDWPLHSIKLIVLDPIVWVSIGATFNCQRKTQFQKAPCTLYSSLYGPHGLLRSTLELLSENLKSKALGVEINPNFKVHRCCNAHCPTCRFLEFKQLENWPASPSASARPVARKCFQEYTLFTKIQLNRIPCIH